MTKTSIAFKFIEFNPRRKARGVEACRVEVTEDGEAFWLWMSKADIGRNMMEFGSDAELHKAWDAYEPAVKEA